jgi:DNA damage-binding protein 1
MVFGGLDGLTTSTAIVCSTNGISERPDIAINKMALGASVLFAFGLANLVADGFSMGMGDLLSTLAEIDQKAAADAMREATEKDRIQPSPVLVGLNGEHISTSTRGITSDVRDDVEADDTDGPETKLTALLNGCVMFLSFVIFGVVPLLAYSPIIAPTLFAGHDAWRFRVSCVLCMASLFVLGALKGLVVTRKGRRLCTWSTAHVRAGFLMVLTGSVASFLSFAVSVIAHQFFAL